MTGSEFFWKNSDLSRPKLIFPAHTGESTNFVECLQTHHYVLHYQIRSVTWVRTVEDPRPLWYNNWATFLDIASSVQNNHWKSYCCKLDNNLEQSSVDTHWMLKGAYIFQSIKYCFIIGWWICEYESPNQVWFVWKEGCDVNCINLIMTFAWPPIRGKC